ncbi:MAG TPA: hypothetical protein VGG41_01860 [Solirubrobacteraceae bacterium]|jgi:hypothetical protein
MRLALRLLLGRPGRLRTNAVVLAALGIAFVLTGHVVGGPVLIVSSIVLAAIARSAPRLLGE